MRWRKYSPKRGHGEECLFADVTVFRLLALYRVWSRLAPISEIEKEIDMKNITAVALFIAAM